MRYYHTRWAAQKDSARERSVRSRSAFCRHATFFFALISYTPKDIPSWFWFSHVSPANHPLKISLGR